MITQQGDNMIIYIQDCLRAGYCVRGVKDYCKARGIDFRHLVRYGVCIEQSKIEIDGYVQKVIDLKQKEIDNEEKQ